MKQNPSDELKAPARDSWWQRLRRKWSERKARLEVETPAERAARRSGNTNTAIAIFTAALALVAVEQAYMLGAQVEVMRSQQRAWVYGVENRFVLEIGKTLGFQLVLHNRGNTPAKNVTGKFRLEIMNATDPPTFDLSQPHLVGGFGNPVMVPGDHFPVGVGSLVMVPGTETSTPIVWDGNLDHKFKNRDIWIAAVGVMSYVDVYKRTHWAHVCYADFFIAQGEVSSDPAGPRVCVQYNDTDD